MNTSTNILKIVDIVSNQPYLENFRYYSNQPDIKEKKQHN